MWGWEGSVLRTVSSTQMTSDDYGDFSCDGTDAGCTLDLTYVQDGCSDCLNATEIEDIYLLNNGDAGTGVFDFGGATSFEIPNAADPTVDATGEIAVDTTTSTIRFYDGSNEQVLSPIRTPKVFFASEYSKKRAEDLLSQERSLLPATQHLVEAQKQREKRNEQYKIYKMN